MNPTSNSKTLFSFYYRYNDLLYPNYDSDSGVHCQDQNIPKTVTSNFSFCDVQKNTMIANCSY